MDEIMTEHKIIEMIEEQSLSAQKAFEAFINMHTDNLTHYEAVIRLLTIKISCEKLIADMQRYIKDKAIIELCSETEKILRKAIHSSIIIKRK